MSFAFHCAGPPGEWINDPNGLFFADGRYRLLMQHSPAPEPGPVGWGAASSDDLVRWRWDGVAIPPDAHDHAYSGCVVGDDVYLTRHDPATRRQTQHRRGLASDADSPAIGPAGRNRRDPFVFWNRATEDWRMLVAAPCDWTDWRDDPPSTVELWRSTDRTDWSRVGRIGPWSPMGVMWEMPVLFEQNGQCALILSIVDRRRDLAECGVRYWTGRFGEIFLPDPECPAEGRPLDLGPDFYAAILSSDHEWPLPERLLIAWASNWQFARLTPWSGDVRGGPLTLPRAISMTDGRLRQRPAALVEHLACWGATAKPAFRLHLARGDCHLVVTVDQDGAARVERSGCGQIDWSRAYPPGTLAPNDARALTLFVDADLCELFIAPDGVAVTAALAGNTPVRITLT